MPASVRLPELYRAIVLVAHFTSWSRESLLALTVEELSEWLEAVADAQEESQRNA